jgi:hypothetical protein
MKFLIITRLETYGYQFRYFKIKSLNFHSIIKKQRAVHTQVGNSIRFLQGAIAQMHNIEYLK